jgi:integrase
VRRAEEVRRLRDEEGLSIKETAKRLGLAENTVSVLYRQRPQQVISQAQVMLALLAASGARNSEICALRPIDLDFAHRKIRVEHAKTSKGVREIDMTPWLCEQLQAWVRELGPDYDPRAPLFLNDRGNPYNKDVLNLLVKRIQAEAQHMCVERGLAPLPVQLTAHVFRRTYITHMFEASAAPSYVQEQVGHEDARTTIGIYSRVLRTRDRAKLGRAFDALLGCADAEEPPDGEEGMALAA